MSQEHDQEAHAVSDPNAIAHLRRAALRQGLILEIHGMNRGSRQSAYSIIKKQFGLKGNRQHVLEQFTNLIEEQRPPTP